MRHATSWRKNQSEDDAFGRSIETSSPTTTVDIELQSPSLSKAPPADTIHILFDTRLHQQRVIAHIIIIVIITIPRQKDPSRSHYVYYCLYGCSLASIYSSTSVMQQLSNDTGSWNLIDSPLRSPLFYNSSTYESAPHGSAAINDLNAPITSLTGLPSVTLEASSGNYWALVLMFFPLLTIFGNVLVVISVYREKSLHTVTNYFVVSLAISDITVAAVVMPFAIYLEVSDNVILRTIRHRWRGNEFREHVVTVRDAMES